MPAASAASASPAQTVTTVRAVQRDEPVTLEAAGTVVSLNSVDVRPQVSSTVREVAIREGQDVARGQMLFRLDDRNERAALDKARAQVLRDQASLADAERQWRRSQELLAQNFVSSSAVDTAKAQVDVQRATLEADRAALQAAEVALTYTAIRSPLAGRAGAIVVKPGALVQPTGAVLVSISQIDPIGVSFNLPESELAGVLAQGGRRVPLTVRLPVRAVAGAATPSPAGVASSGPGMARDTEWSGELTFIDNAVDNASGTVKVKGTVANPQRLLWPGQYVQVRLTLRTIRGAILVPQAAVIQRGAERLVYVVDDQGKAQARPVQVRQGRGEWVVVDGVAAGEAVVVEGKQNLRPGTSVKPEAKPSGAASPASAANGASGAASS